MDLSWLKWPLIVAAVALVAWLMSSSGVNYMVGRYTKATPGVNAEQDKADEAGLSRVSHYALTMFQYDKCEHVIELTIDRYGPKGANYWKNLERLTICYEKKGRYQRSHDVLQLLIKNNASSFDKRLPKRDALVYRAQRLKEVHQLK